LSAKTEFGYKALLTETEDRVITHYEVTRGIRKMAACCPVLLQYLLLIYNYTTIRPNLTTRSAMFDQDFSALFDREAA